MNTSPNLRVRALRWDKEAVATLDAFRKKRHLGGYERIGVVSDHEASEMVVLAGRLQNEIAAWLRRNHRSLCP